MDNNEKEVHHGWAIAATVIAFIIFGGLAAVRGCEAGEETKQTAIENGLESGPGYDSWVHP